MSIEAVSSLVGYSSSEFYDEFGAGLLKYG